MPEETKLQAIEMRPLFVAFEDQVREDIAVAIFKRAKIRHNGRNIVTIEYKEGNQWVQLHAVKGTVTRTAYMDSYPFPSVKSYYHKSGFNNGKELYAHIQGILAEVLS